MSQRIEEYALIGDCEGAGLVSLEGSIDWLCLPSFDSRATFAALLGDDRHGFWKICPEGQFQSRRNYRGKTMILETHFQTSTGAARVIDWLSFEDDEPILARIIEGVEGEVAMCMDLSIRFDYGSIVPWITRTSIGSVLAIGGPDSLELQTTFPVREEDKRIVGRFVIKPGQVRECALVWRPSHHAPNGKRVNCRADLERNEAWWKSWIARCSYEGTYKEEVERSLLVLKALTYYPTGGIVAAPTTSLPESLGGVRNWDYRFSWVRDSTFVLYALLSTGFKEEAKAWNRWLTRAIAGTPEQVNIMYGIHGERRLTEVELEWLPGYEGSKPVRIGNLAYNQRQLDIFGELLGTLYLAGRAGLEPSEASWALQLEIMKFLESEWDEPDEGIWEVRGGRQHFVHSKVMAWVAVDSAIKTAEKFDLKAPLDEWKRLRIDIKTAVMEKGFSRELNSFTQYYGSKNVDASLLMLPLVGFIDPLDERMRGTVRRIENELMRDGFVLRYRTEVTKDGLPGDEGVFLACSFWLVDNYVISGEIAKAEALFDRLLKLRNDVGLLAEQYDTTRERQVGNFPQALSHIALIISALNLRREAKGPAKSRSESRSERPERNRMVWKEPVTT